MKNKRTLIISIISLSLFFLIRHFLFYDRGLSLFEEGHPFYIYDALSKGKLLYRDVFFYAAPLANYFYAAVVKIFGAELLNIRAASIIVSSLGLLVIFFILKEFVSYFWAWIGSIVSYCLYYLWFYKYGYELGSLFCYLSILSAFLFIKKNKNLYFILTILFSAGSFAQHIITQGIPLFLSILTVLIIFYKRINYKYILIYFFSVILINLSIFSIFIYKSSLNQVIYNIAPFLYGEVSKVGGIEYKFPFFNVFKYYNVSFSNNISPAFLYMQLKGLIYVFIYYLPIVNLIMLKINYSKISKNWEFHLKFLYINILFYSLYSYARIYLFFPQGHSDAFFASPSLLFFYINSFYLLIYLCKKIKYNIITKTIKYCTISCIAFFYLIIQVPNLNPELNEKEFTYKHIKGIKTMQGEVEYINKQILAIENHSKKGDYLFTQEIMLNVITERTSPIEDKLYFLRPIFSAIEDIDSKFIIPENIKKVEQEFVDRLISKKVKVIFFTNDNLEKINENNLNKLKNLLETKYKQVKYLSFNQSEYRHLIGGNLEINVFVLREGL